MHYEEDDKNVFIIFKLQFNLRPERIANDKYNYLIILILLFHNIS